jgi:hypothetical protein
MDACDVNDSGAIEVGDPVLLLNHVFLNGRPPPTPWGACGPDPTPDDLTCESFAACQ